MGIGRGGGGYGNNLIFAIIMRSPWECESLHPHDEILMESGDFS